MDRLLEFCPKIGRAYIQSLMDEAVAKRSRESRRNGSMARLLEEAKARDELATKIALEEEEEEREADAKLIAREEADKTERERVTLGEFYPAFAPGCGKTKIPRERYDDDRREKVEENYSADRRLTGQFFWNRGLGDQKHYGAGRFSSLIKSAEEQEVTYAAASRAAKIYKHKCTSLKLRLS